MRLPNLLFLLATSTTLVNTKNVSRRFYTQSTFHSTKRFRKQFNNSFNNYYFKRTFATNYNFQNVSSSFVFQPSQNKYNQTSEIFPAIPILDENNKNNINDNKPSLMILIGWWNCKPKNLSKYISLYTDKFHIDTLSHIPPFYHVFIPWKISNNINRLAKELIQIWIERGKPNNIGFHVFSDNGIYHYALLCEAIRQLSRGSHFMSSTPIISNSSSTSGNISEEAESFLNSIKSCVIDSAPSPISEKYIALGIAGGFMHKLDLLDSKITSNDPSSPSSSPSSSPLSSPSSSPLSSPSSSSPSLIDNEQQNTIVSSLPLSFLTHCLSLFFSLPIVKKYQNLVHKALDNIPGGTFDGRNIKFLFLYGPGDEIIPEDEVIKFMKKLKNRDKIYSNNNSNSEYSNNEFSNNNKKYIHKSGKGEKNEKNEEKNKVILKIMEKRFKIDSGHVQHFMKYPEEYINALELFYELK
ncbi:hypothetical protein Glove_202g64 [Diversispora epigaea]|uniref:Transmembrane protein 53 n=1 Tax=Diversispora epigaea TaxID=1348612 RepID=A0A397IJX1_9GLOM|nr:hypothetical protein Glove_202g64 [Diversispora epigaea]